MSSIPTMFNRALDGAITGVTFLIGGKPYMADQSIPTFSDLLNELKKATPDTDRLVALTTPAQAIVKAVEAAVASDYLTAGVVSVSTSEVRYNGEQVTGVLVDRILQMLAEGFDIMPMVRFLEKLYQNPATYARDELYLWLENSNLPITQDGDFLAYKMVNNEYRSRNNFLNLPGTTVSMPRQACDPVRDHLCSTGLHFCSRQYIGGNYPNDYGKLVILKINPADVVSIPYDSGNSKGRAWKYDILGDFGENPQTKQWPAVVADNGEPIGIADPAKAPLTFPSDLSKALYAALTEIGVKDGRKRWAGNILGRKVSSFKELTVGDASELISRARAIKANQDNEATRVARVAATAARKAAVDAINSYGIVTLRKLTGKWKNATVAELRAQLIAAL